MQIGMMNDPRKDPVAEAQWAADHDFEFLDLTIEGPCASLEQLDVPAIRSVLQNTGLDVVGHTAWYLPFASPVARVRQAAIESIVDTFETFATLGASLVNVHPSSVSSLFTQDDMIRWNSESFAQIAERAVPYGLRIMVENLPNSSFKISDFRKILRADDRLGFHLDVGHANIGGDKLEGMLKTFKARLVHVHLSDNRGRSDEHLPIGAGTIDWPRVIRLLRKRGFDGTITLEVFSSDLDYLLLSKQKVLAWWQEAIDDEEADENPESGAENPESGAENPESGAE